MHSCSANFELYFVVCIKHFIDSIDVVSCQVGLYMKIEPVLDSAGIMINVSKTLLCNDHKPAGARPFQPMIDNSIDNDGRPPAPPKEKSKSRSRACRRRKDRKNASASDEIDQSACNVPLIPLERSVIIAFNLNSSFYGLCLD